MCELTASDLRYRSTLDKTLLLTDFFMKLFTTNVMDTVTIRRGRQLQWNDDDDDGQSACPSFVCHSANFPPVDR